MARKRYSFHPICLLFPRMTDEELHDLADDIRIKGLLHDIKLYQGKILDGRNRYLACPMAGVEPRFTEWDGKGSPLEWVISENMVRRHLSSSQKAVIAHDLLPMLQAEAKERQRLSPGRGKKVGKNLRTFSGNNGRASNIAARITKTNPAYVQAVKTIQQQAPELVEEVRSGRLKVPDAVRLANLPKAKREKVLKALHAGGPDADLKQSSRVGSDGQTYWVERRNGLPRKLKRNANNLLDYYPTPADVVDSLLAREQFKGMILEPASGDGAIVRVLRKAGYAVKKTDVTDGVDFLGTKKSVSNVITNPPYSEGMAEKFCRHALEIATCKVAMLLPIWFLVTVQRHDLFAKQPLKAIYIFSRNPTFGDGDHHAPFGALWAVWDKGYRGKPRIEWILD